MKQTHFFGENSWIRTTTVAKKMNTTGNSTALIGTREGEGVIVAVTGAIAVALLMCAVLMLYCGKYRLLNAPDSDEPTVDGAVDAMLGRCDPTVRQEMAVQFAAAQNNPRDFFAPNVTPEWLAGALDTANVLQHQRNACHRQLSEYFRRHGIANASLHAEFYNRPRFKQAKVMLSCLAAFVDFGTDVFACHKIEQSEFDDLFRASWVCLVVSSIISIVGTCYFVA